MKDELVKKPKEEQGVSTKAEGQEGTQDDQREDTGQEVSPQATNSDPGNSWFASWGVGDLAKKVQNTVSINSQVKHFKIQDFI